MAMVVKNNMTAVNTLNILNKNSSALSKSLQKVSSGMKINSAADDASGYAISERMRVQIRSLDQANQNTQNGSSMMKVAEGAVSSTVEILKTLKEKAVNAANDSNTDSDRLTIQKELDQSIDQINDNANVTFNGKYLVDGSKNSKGNATYTALSNQNLSVDTTATTALTDLASRSGDSLEIHETDKVTVSYVQGGKTYSTTFQVGNKTLQDIFSAAEDIDDSSQIFATSSNESVKAAGGVDSVALESPEKQAIAYLQQQLSDGRTAAATAITGTSKYAGGGTAGTLKPAGTGTDLESQVYTSDGKNLPAGKLYSDLITADKAVKKAEDALGAYDRADEGDASKTFGAAGNLGKQLSAAGIAWDGSAAQFNTSDLQNAIEAAYNDPNVDVVSLRDAVNTYKESQSAYEKATDNYDTASNAYDTAQKQLAAVTKQQAVNNAVDSANTLKDALVAVFSNKLEAQAAADATKKISYSDVVIKTDGTLDAATVDHAGVDNTAENRAAAVKAFEDALSKAMNTTGKEDTAVTNLLAKFKIDTTAMTDATGFGTAAKAIGTAKNDITTADKPYLKSAEEEIVSKFSGPAILTGKNVGMDAAGNVVGTASGDNAITITANTAGIGGQISGLNISISDSEGNVKKSANASLDAFEETVRAQNKSEDNAINLQVGARANQSIKVGLTDMRAEALGLQGADGTKLNISRQDKANAAINVLDNAIAKALDQQTTIGAVESRLEYTSSNLTTASENVQASESTIRDADMAKEMTNYTRNNVLLQAAQSMLAQANQSSSNVLSLLQ